MRKLLAIVITLGVLLVAADIAARKLAEQRIEHEVGQQLPTGLEPSATIHGWSFLLQALSGEYDDVTIAVSEVPLGDRGDTATVSLDLHDATLPMSAAFSGDLSRLTVDRAIGRVRIPQSALASVLQRPGLTVAPGGDEHSVNLHTSVAAAGRTFPVTVTVRMTLADDALRLTVANTSAPDGVPAELTQGIASQFSVTIPLTGPVHLTEPTTIAVDGTDVVVTSTARDVDAAALGLTGSS